MSTKKKLPQNEQAAKETEAARVKVLDKYCALAERKMAHPTRPDMHKAGYNRDRIRQLFGSHTEMKDAAKKYKPDAFKNIVEETFFTRKKFEELRTEAGKFNRYFVTTAVLGCKVFEPFYAAILNFKKRRSAMPLLLTASDPAANVSKGKKKNPAKWFVTLGERFPALKIVFDDMALNDNVHLSAIKLSAKQRDPVTGLNQLGQRNGSFLYGGPQQRLKYTPTSNTTLPHAMMTTGALTMAAYTTKRYMSERLAALADNEHVMGGIVVEIPDDQLFHFRQVQADRVGSFIDLAVRYMPDGTTMTVRPEALVLGDWHSGETDPAAREAFVGHRNSLIMLTKPRRLVVHDGFNGRSISHHEEKNKILRAQRARENQLNLEQELRAYADDLAYLASFDFVEEVVISWSNHDAFLSRYLETGRFMEDPQNYHLALRLSSAMIDGKNPLQFHIESLGIKGASKIRWLSEDEDFKIANIELGAHGHRGPSGARGSLRGMLNSYGQSVSGHAHTPEILRGAWQVGTCSLLKLNYNSGPSSWLHSSCLVYGNGSRQLVNVIFGEWRLED